MARSLRDSVADCIDQISSQRHWLETVNASRHPTLSATIIDQAKRILSDQRTALELWFQETRHSLVTDEEEFVGRLLHGITSRLEIVDEVLRPLGNSQAFSQSERQIQSRRLVENLRSIEDSIESLRTLSKFIQPNDPRQSLVHNDIRRSQRAQQLLYESFLNRIRDLSLVRRRNSFSYDRNSASVDIGRLEWLWIEFPRISGLDGTEDWTDPKDGVRVEEIHIDKARSILDIFCNAWKDSNSGIADESKFGRIRNMGKIAVILCLMRRSIYFDRFIDFGADDDSVPFSRSLIRNVFPEREGGAADEFFAHQFRVVPKYWPEKSNIKLRHIEPLPLKQMHGYGEGGYSVVDKVEDVFTKEIYARKVQRGNADAGHLQNEIERLSDLGADGKEHHIVKYVKSYIRGGQFGVLFKPAATANLEQLLRRYCREQETRQAYLPILLKAFGCLGFSLAYIHNDKETRHRDIKPENILYHRTPNSAELLWSDFGLAKTFNQTHKSVTTSSFNGSIEYAAPETLRNDEHGRSADVFSFGCVLLEILGAILTETTSTERGALKDLFPYCENISKAQLWLNSRISEIPRDHSKYRFVPLLELCRRMVNSSAPDRPKINQIVEYLIALHRDQFPLFCRECLTNYRDARNKQKKILYRSLNVTWRKWLPHRPS